MIEATIDGVQFSTEAGATYTIGRLEGWYSSPPVKSSVSERPRADGAFRLSDFQRSARPITMSGQVHSSADGQPEWSALAAVASSGAPVTFTVTDSFGELSSTVIPMGSALSLTPITATTAEYVLSLVAFDPVKYAAPRTLTTGLPTAGGGLTYELFEPSDLLDYGANGELGRVTLTNAGTAAVWPTITVTGALTDGFFVQRLDTGQRVRYDRIVPAGTDVVVDFRTGSVVVDGESDGSTYLTVAEFFSVAPGESFEVQFNSIGASSGSPELSVQISDGFW